MSILHVLQFSLPEILSGYTIRSQAILQWQQSQGLDPIAITSPRHPSPEDAHVDGVRYFRSGPERARAVWLRDLQRVRILARRICEIAGRRDDIRVLHAHSPVLCGMAALRAAQRLQLPVVYEVRGLWEETMLQHRPWRRWLPRYRLASALETRVCQRAAALVTLSQGLRREFARRGVPEANIHVVGNGVDTECFAPSEPSFELRQKLKLGSGPIILYLGALRTYEGIDVLLAAIERVKKRVAGAQLLIVGGGEDAQRISEKSQSGDEAVRVLPRTPHAQTLPLYSIADIVVYPRISTRATELVTPLKPLEAMAMGKAIVASDVGGLRELVSDGKTARLVTPGSADDLADAISTLLERDEERKRLGQEARRVAVERYDWRKVLRGYVDVYGSAGLAR